MFDYAHDEDDEQDLIIFLAVEAETGGRRLFHDQSPDAGRRTQ